MDPQTITILLGRYPGLMFGRTHIQYGSIHQEVILDGVSCFASWSAHDYKFFLQHDGLDKITVQVKMIEMALREKRLIN